MKKKTIYVVREMHTFGKTPEVNYDYVYESYDDKTYAFESALGLMEKHDLLMQEKYGVDNVKRIINEPEDYFKDFTKYVECTTNGNAYHLYIDEIELEDED